MLDFLGIGAQKAGTTWLYEMLSFHPGVAFPGGKEVHYWDASSRKELSWYSALFDEHDGKRKGEITPAYALLPPETVRDVFAMNPALRIVFLLRNPIERAWSSALMAVARAEMSVAEASDQWFIDHFRSRGSLQRGDYESCIKNWRQIFGKEALLLLRYEDIHAAPRDLLRTCCKHIGAAADEWVETLPDATITRRVFAGMAVKIRPKLLEELLALYQPKISSLADYLETDLSSWLQIRLS